MRPLSSFAALALASGTLGLTGGCLETSTSIRCTEGKAFNDELTECTRCLPGRTRRDLADGGFECIEGTPDAGTDAPADATPPEGGADGSACPTACAGPTPHCDPEADRCVECLSGNDCMESAPLCREADGTCVECLSSDECFPGAPLCREADGTCVDCLADSDCSDPAAAKCDTATGACVPCDASSQCGGLTGTEACETVGPQAGECVECTAAETGACDPGKPCNPLTNECSAYGEGTQRLCDPCDADENCMGHAEGAARCIQLEYQGSAHGTFCLKPSSMGCEQPFSITTDARPSASGASAEPYCGINEMLATCEAVRSLIDNVQCPEGMSSECPGPGAVCNTVGALSNRCTYRCAGAVQCNDAAPGDTCGDGDQSCDMGDEECWCGG